MKHTKKNLTIYDWQRYKNDVSNNKFEKILSADDMNYLAAKGFEKTNNVSADKDELISRIDSKTFSSINLNAIFIGGIIVVVFTTFFCLLIKPEKNKKAGPRLKNTQTEQTTIFSYPKTNIFISAGQKDYSFKNEKTSKFPKEHFSIKNREELSYSQEEDKELVNITTNHITSIASENNTYVNLEQLPNAPIIYINSFAITNYHIYYFKNNTFQLLNGGVDPQYSDGSSFKSNRVEIIEGDKTTADQVVREAIDYFSQQKYAECIASFDLLLKINKEDVNAFFYSGMSYFYTEKNERAISFFDKVLESENNIFHQEAAYYKSNALLAQGKTLEARALLAKIIDAKGFYANRSLILFNAQ